MTFVTVLEWGDGLTSCRDVTSTPTANNMHQIRWIAPATNFMNAVVDSLLLAPSVTRSFIISYNFSFDFNFREWEPHENKIKAQT